MLFLNRTAIDELRPFSAGNACQDSTYTSAAASDRVSKFAKKSSGVHFDLAEGRLPAG
jgi:hypothetical protein